MYGIKAGVGILLFGGLAACAPQLPLMTMPDVPGTLSFRSQAASDRVIGYDTVQVRSFVEDETASAKMREAVGATCKMKSPEFTTTFVTPRKVPFPAFAGKPGTLSMTCRYQGAVETDTTEARPYVRSVGPPGYSPGGVAGALVGLAVNTAVAAAHEDIAQTRDHWSYVPKGMVVLNLRIYSDDP